MTVCLNCGKTINNVSRECPHCHKPITFGGIASENDVKHNKIEYDCRDSKLTLISAIIFPYGLFYYFKNKSEYPLKSNSALGGAFIGIIVIAIIVSMLLIVNLVK